MRTTNVCCWNYQLIRECIVHVCELLFQFPDTETLLDSSDATIFRYVQMLLSQSTCPKSDKLKRIWEPTYTYTFLALVKP